MPNDRSASASHIRAVPSAKTETPVRVNEALKNQRYWPQLAELLTGALVQLARRANSISDLGLHNHQLFVGIDDVVFATLLDGDKVERIASQLWVDAAPLRQTLSLADGAEPAFLQALLYVVHELIHHDQRIEKMSTIAALRATGAEQELMHLDLAADHAAVVIVAAAFPHWSIHHLKAMQAQALGGYPVTAAHAASARKRKATRQVAILADAYARRAGLLPELDFATGTYLYVIHPPTGGVALLMQAGRIPRVLAQGLVSAAQVSLFERAADEGGAVLPLFRSLARDPARRLRELEVAVASVWPELERMAA